jgi:hypothetical protein
MSEIVTSLRALARGLGLSHTALQKAARAGRILPEPDGRWDPERVRRDMAATALPGHSPLAVAAQETAFGRLSLARLALKVEAHRLALDHRRGRLVDVALADARIDEIAAGMRDAVLNWPARIAGEVAAALDAEPHLVQTLLQEHVAMLLNDVADRIEGQATGG